MHRIFGFPCLWLWEERAGECYPLSFLPGGCSEVAAFLPKSRSSCWAAPSSRLPSSQLPYLLSSPAQAREWKGSLGCQPWCFHRPPRVFFNPAHTFVNSPSLATLHSPPLSKPSASCWDLKKLHHLTSGSLVMRTIQKEIAGLWGQRGDRGREVKRKSQHQCP